MRCAALPNAANANWGIRALNRGAKILEEDVFESSGRGLNVRVQERGVVGRETTQRVNPEGERQTTNPVGAPVLSRVREASKSSKSRTKSNEGTRESILDELRTG